MTSSSNDCRLYTFYSCPSEMGNYHVFGSVCMSVCVSVCLCVCLSVNKLEATIFEAETSYLEYTSTMVPSRSLLKLVEIG